MRKPPSLFANGALSARRVLSAAGLLALALFGVCGSPRWQASAQTSGGSGDYRLEIHTCPVSSAAAYPQTDDPVQVSFSTYEETFWGSWVFPYHGSGLVILDNPGNDRETNLWDVYRFNWPSTAGAITKLRSIRIDKQGGDAWCFDQVRLFWRNDLLFNWDSSVNQPFASYVPMHTRPGPIVLDNDAADARAPYVRFTNQSSMYSKPGYAGLNPRLEFRTCTDKALGTADNVYVDVSHGGLTDSFLVPAANRDGGGDIFVLPFSRLEPVQTISQVRVRTSGSDPLCLDWMRITDDSVLLIGMPIYVRWVDNVDRDNISLSAPYIYYPNHSVCSGTTCNAAARMGFNLTPYTRHMACAAGGGSTGTDNTCNAIDEDCDGTPDQQFVGTLRTCGQGACARNLRDYCQGGLIVTPVCNPTLGAQTEACDNVDNNCDGLVDNAANGQPLSTSYTCGFGVCAESATRTCTGGRWVDSCAPKSCATLQCSPDPQCRVNEGGSCTKDPDCDPGLVCSPTGQCRRPQCFNGVRDPDEQKVDCGGVCPACTTESCADACRVGEQTASDAIASLRFSTGTFTRAGTATYEQREGEVVTARANELRWVDRYDTRLALFEGAGTNLFRQSEAFQANPPWVPQAAPSLVITANQGRGANGTQTAELVAFTNGPGRGPMQTVQVPGTTATFSLYASAVPASTTGAVPRARVFALGASNAVLGTKTFYLEEAPYRYDLPFTATAANNASILLSHMAGFPTPDTQASESGDYYIWGAQLEVQPFPTSYIPTTMSTASRSPDSLIFTSTQLSPLTWLRTGTFQIEVAPLYASSEMVNGVEYTLLSYGIGNDVAFVRTGGVTRLRVRIGNTTIYNRPLIWERGAAMSLTFDNAADKITVLGADLGDGEQAAAGLAFPAGNLRIGGVLGGTGEAFAAISEPREIAGATKTCTVDTSCTCGNGVVDAGEVCDVGRDARCNATCSGRELTTGSTDNDCPNGQILVKNAGDRFGLAAGASICMPPVCSDCGTVDSPCGKCLCTPNCENAACGSPLGDGCGGVCPGVCAPGATGCRSDVECGSGNACVDSVCRPELCANPRNRAVSCGPYSLCGPCPSTENLCGDRQCGLDQNLNVCGACVAGSACSVDGQCTVAKDPEVPAPVRPGIVDAVTTGAGRLPGSLSVSESGSAIYTIPIEVPPGRAGLQPSLSLQYDSATRDGFVGRGWSLTGLSAITRCHDTFAQDGQARGVRLSAEDHFCLDGQRLVQYAQGAGSGPTYYRTEVESFRSILSFGGTLIPYSGPDYFQVKVKDGQLWTYGRSASARVRAKFTSADDNVSSDTTVNVAWYLEKIEDRHGNNIKISYESDWKGRQGFRHVSEVRPTTITYGNRGSHAVSITYDDTRNLWGEQGFASGVGKFFSAPISRITTSVDGVNVRAYRLDGEVRGASWYVRSVTACDPAGGQEVCLQPTLFDYEFDKAEMRLLAEPRDETGHIPLSHKKIKRYYHEHYWGIWAPTVLDWNGDGFDDLVHGMFRGNQERDHKQWVQLRVSRGKLEDGWAFERGIDLSPSITETEFWEGAATVDGNWDRRDDLARVVRYKASNGALLRGASLLTSTATGVTETVLKDDWRAPQWVDFDGDGLVDVVSANTLTSCNGGAQRNIMIGFRRRLASGTFASPVVFPVLVDCRDDYAAGASDLDGDGADDFWLERDVAGGVSYNADAFEKTIVRYVNGSVQQTKLDPTPWGADSRVTTKALDANGDGLKDVLVRLKGASSLTLYLNSGRGFIPGRTSPSWSDVSLDLFQYSFALDSDGDGREELFVPQEDTLQWRIIRPMTYAEGKGAQWTTAVAPFPYQICSRTRSDRIGNTFHPTVYNWQGPFTMDFDGDGIRELVLRTGACSEPTLAMWQLASPVTGLLKAVTDGFLKRTTLEYTTGVVDQDGECAYPSRCLKKVPKPVVSAYTETGDSGPFRDPRSPSSPTSAKTSRRMEYEYRGPRTDLSGRGWLGFKSRIVREVALDFPGTVLRETTYTYDLDTHNDTLKMFMHAGKAKNIRERSFSTLSDGTSVTHELERAFDWRVETAFSTANRLWLALRGQVTTYRENNVEISKVSKEFQYDSYGNVTDAATTWSDGRHALVSSTYMGAGDGTLWSSLQAKWLIGLPKEVTVTGANNIDLPFAARETKSFKLIHTYEEDGDIETLSRIVGSSLEEKSVFKYDRFGNVEEMLRSGRGREAFDSQLYVAYDDAGLYPIRQESGMHRLRGLAPIEMGFDPRTGSMKWRRESDGSWQTWNRDGFGRLSSTYRSDGTHSKVSYGRGTLSGARFSVAQSGNNEPDVVTEYNAYEQPIYQRRWDFGNVSSVREWGYDARGRLMAESSPHLFTDPVTGVHQYAYDDLNRLIRERHPVVLPSGAVDAPLETHDYISLGTSTTPILTLAWTMMPGAVSGVVHTDALGHKTQQVFGMRSETVATVDPGGNRTLYSYGAFDHLKKRTFLDTETTFTTDTFGQVTRMVDPISGVHEYVRDGFGWMKEYRHNGALTTFDYDGLGRLYRSTTPDGLYEWNWDGDGTDPTQAQRLVSESVTSSTIGNSRTTYDYHGPGGAITGIHREIEGETFDTLIEHEIVTVIGQGSTAIARPKFVRFPVKNAANQPVLEVAQYTYDRFGRVSAVWDGSSPAKKYWELVKTDAYGNDAEVKVIGGTGGLTSRKTVEPATGRLSVAETLSASGQTLQRELYQYDARGLLAGKADVVQGVVQTFQHDAYGRLDSHIINNVLYDYDYDAFGNLTRKHEVGALHYAPGKPYQLTSTDSGISLEYDASGNGNQVLRQGAGVAGGRQEIAYTAFDLPLRVSSGPAGSATAVTSYRYDASNVRTVQQVQNGTRTLYAGDAYRRIEAPGMPREQVIDIPTPSGPAIEVSISDAGARAVRALHTDHLGSTAGVTNAAGEVSERRYYDPFGQQSSTVGMSSVRAGFTGHEHDASTGLINMRGRMYDPLTGRFITPDPIVQSPGNSQSWNRYSYVMNSPLSFVDPSGFEAEPMLNLGDIYGPVMIYGSGGKDSASSSPVEAPGTMLVNGAITPELPPAIAGHVPGGVSVASNHDKLEAPVNQIMNPHERANAILEDGKQAGGFWGLLKAFFSRDHLAALDELGAFDLIKAFGGGGPGGAVSAAVHETNVAVHLSKEVGKLAARGASEATSALKGAQLTKHLSQIEKYGAAGFKELQNGRIRYFGEVTKASKAGEMAGRRVVREWNPATNRTRTWMETLDHAGTTRIVRPETGGPKVHYLFDAAGNFTGTF